MTLTSEIIGMQHLQPGERVGYGFAYEAVGEMTIGIVACGYADGYPRHAAPARRCWSTASARAPLDGYRWT